MGGPANLVSKMDTCASKTAPLEQEIKNKDNMYNTLNSQYSGLNSQFNQYKENTKKNIDTNLVAYRDSQKVGWENEQTAKNRLRDKGGFKQVETPNRDEQGGSGLGTSSSGMGLGGKKKKTGLLDFI